MFPGRRDLHIPASWPPTLVVVIDTEEEFDWDAPFDPGSVSVRNIDEQWRAQAVFDEHGIRPTYLVDYPVAANPASRAVLREFVASGRCEIGAHLHPWVTPPHEGPVDARTSFGGNLPPALERAKLAALTGMIEAGFGRRPTVFRAGRYGVGPSTMGSLAALGYKADSSVVPFTDFSAGMGPDFSAFDGRPFLSEGMVEVPLSVGFAGGLAAAGRTVFPMLGTPMARRLRLAGVAARLGLLERLRLSPEGHGVQDMVRQTQAAMAQGTRLFMMTYHSSSLLPGGAPYVRDEADRRAFVRTVADYCAYFMGPLGGRADTLLGVATVLAG